MYIKPSIYIYASRRFCKAVKVVSSFFVNVDIFILFVASKDNFSLKYSAYNNICVTSKVIACQLAHKDIVTFCSEVMFIAQESVPPP